MEKVRDKYWYNLFKFHDESLYPIDELEEYSDRNHVPETSLSFSSSYTQEEWENMKSTVKVQKKNKDGIIIEDYSYDYFPNKKKKKGKTK